jgi:hypothetical protein
MKMIFNQKSKVSKINIYSHGSTLATRLYVLITNTHCMKMIFNKKSKVPKINIVTV